MAKAAPLQGDDRWFESTQDYFQRRPDTPTGRATRLKPECLQVRVLLWVLTKQRLGRQLADYVDTLAPGLYAFWKDAAQAKLVEIDLRETTADVSGQEIMTANKVSLRMNAIVTYRIVNARKAVNAADDVRQTLYRETQLALRAVVGARELDAFLTDKDMVTQEIEQAVRRRAGELVLVFGQRTQCILFQARIPTKTVTTNSLAKECSGTDLCTL